MLHETLTGGSVVYADVAVMIMLADAVRLTHSGPENRTRINQIKECMSDSVTNYNYVGDTKISVSIKKLMPTNAH